MDKRRVQKNELSQVPVEIKEAPKINLGAYTDSLQIGDAIAKQILVGFETTVRNKHINKQLPGHVTKEIMFDNATVAKYIVFRDKFKTINGPIDTEPKGIKSDRAVVIKDLDQYPVLKTCKLK